MPTLPRFDQATDFTRHRATRALGGTSIAGHIGRYVCERAGGTKGSRAAAYARLLHALDHGQQVSLAGLQPTMVQQLDAADAALDRGRPRLAARLVDRAVRLAYHPSVHYGPLGSPLYLEAERFLAPLRASRAARAMLFDLDPPCHGEAAPSHGASPRRKVLILCHSSWTFIDRVVEDLRQHTDLEIRTVDISTLPVHERPTHALAVRLREQWNRTGRLHPVPPMLQDDLRWADTVMIEWGTYPFAWLSFLDLAPYGVRLVARIHRFESLRPYALLARSTVYDEIAFVAPAVRELMMTSSPRLEQAGGTRILPNIHDLDAFTPSQSRDGFQLVQVGWAVPVKDVEFSLDVLEQLRTIDERYHLTLVGKTLEGAPAPSTAPWARRVQHRIIEAGDAVEQVGYRSDVPDILARAGFLLSSSLNEGTHESVAEAAAAGCIPVVRNWPEIARWGGVSTIYPTQWVIEDVNAAVKRIRAWNSPDLHAEESRRCRDWVTTHRDPETIRRGYTQLLGASEGVVRG